MIQGWETFFEEELKKDDFQHFLSFIRATFATREKIYPPKGKVFRAFQELEAKDVKVVLIGQDPYHQPGQAMGLCFSVPEGVMWPPSLRNIFKELEDDVGVTRTSGDLCGWAKQGVLLLNAYLIVKEGQPLSLATKENDAFTEDVIRYLNDLNQPIVFLLWGGFAKRYSSLLHNPNHLVLKAAHPSPLSANRGGFFGTRPFSKINRYLENHHISPIDWSK
ncbi:MAG: uracil-DNA glycosylase [Candidatus Enteromonas sp.]